MSEYNREDSTFYRSAFENTMVLLEAINAVGDDPEKVREYLKTQKLTGVYGSVRFDQNRIVERDMVLTKVTGNVCEPLQ